MATKHTPSPETTKYFPEGGIGSKLKAEQSQSKLRILPPSKIRFLGRDVEVRLCPESEMKDLAGETLEDKMVLRVRDGQIQIEEMDTVLHELVHMIDYLLSLGLAERQVRLIASSLIGIFQDNQALVSYLTRPIKDNT